MRLIARALAGFALAATIVSSASAQGSVQYIYDDLGRLVGVIDAAGNSATYVYDAVGNLLSIERHSSAAVNIIAFSPASGPVGSTVRISGTGFSTTPSQNAVTFNGTAVTVSSASANQLMVTVPSGATTGTVGVTSPNGSATSASAFTVGANGAPTIASFTPSIGVAGTSVSIAGTNFDTVAGNDKTRLNATFVSPTSASATTLSTLVPPNTGSGPISIATPSGTAVSAADFIVPPTPYTPSDVAVSGQIPFATPTTVTVSTANQIGLMLFDGTFAQRVFVRGTNGMTGHFVGCDVQVTLLDPTARAAAPAACMEGSGFIDTTTLHATGTYTLLVDPVDVSTGSLTLSVYSVPADVTGTMTAGGSPLTVSLGTPGQNAALTFSGTANQRISLRGTNGTIFGQFFGCDVNVRILEPDGTTFVPDTCMEQSGFIDVQALPVTGTYTIQVDPVQYQTGNLTLTLYDVPADTSGTITPGGSPVTASIGTPGQNAALTFSGAANQRISLRGTNGTIFGQFFGCDVNGRILKPDGTALAADTCMEQSGFIDVQTLPFTGTYTIQVDPVQYQTGSLTLTLYDVPSDPSTSLTINGGGGTLTTTTAGQNAQATFSGTSGQQVTVHLAGNTMGSTTVRLLKPDGTQITSATSSSSSFNLATQSLSVTGTFTIVIDAGGVNVGSITVSVTNP